MKVTPILVVTGCLLMGIHVTLTGCPIGSPGCHEKIGEMEVSRFLQDTQKPVYRSGQSAAQVAQALGISKPKIFNTSQDRATISATPTYQGSVKQNSTQAPISTNLPTIKRIP